MGVYRRNLEETPEELRGNPARGDVDIARWVYVAETDEKARRDSEAGLLRHLGHFFGAQTSGYLGQVSTGDASVSSGLDYDALSESTIIHGSPETVVAKIRPHLADAALPALLRRGQHPRLARTVRPRGGAATALKVDPPPAGHLGGGISSAPAGP